MNIIEQLGGYESAKRFANGECSDGFDVQSLRDELLKYRREHNIFEAGDKVIVVQKIWGQDPWDELCYVFNAETHHIVGVGVDISVGFGSSKAYRHATDEEIKIGHRL